MSKDFQKENQTNASPQGAAFSGTQGVSLRPPSYSLGNEAQPTPENEDDPLQVAEGQITFDAEGNDDENSRYFTRVIHWPHTANSGVTLGRGYDMGSRSQNEIRNHLEAVGVESGQISILVQAAGLKGNAAGRFVTNNKERVGTITHEQQNQLFAIVYQELKNDVVRITTKDDVEEVYGETDLENLHPAIMELVVDLRYRGDYHPKTRTRVQPLMVANDLQGLATLMADRGYWVDTYNVPVDRFNRRSQFMQDAINGNYTAPINDGGQTEQGTTTEGETQQNETEQTNLNTGTTWDSHTNARIEAIHPTVKPFAYAFINKIQAELGKTVRVSSGLRSYAEQDKLYAKGRTTGGDIVTKARGGHSYHNFGLAIDIVEIRGSQAIWDGPWEEFGRIGRSLGWEWGGDWSGFVDKPHFQMTFGLSTAQLRELYTANGGNFVGLENAPNPPGPVTDSDAGNGGEQSTTNASGSMGTGTVTATRLNVRSGPGTGNQIVGKLDNGASVSIQQVEGKWLMVGENQWIHGDFVNVTMAETGPTGSGTVTASNLNVRNGAGTSFDKVNMLSSGSQLDIFETDGDWLRIGDNQWVHGNYVEQSESEEGATEQATVTARNSLNVRIGPGTNHEKVRSLPSGATVDIYAREGEWARIGDGEWVHGGFLSTSGDRTNEVGTGVPGGANADGWDIDAAVSHLNSNAEPRSIGYCAKYVRQAMEVGGLSTAGRPGSARGYVTFLPSIGFTEISTTSYIPGDIVVFDAVPGHVHGHIAMWNGTQWVSDFKQRNIIVASGYRNGSYHIYRWQ